MNPFLGILIVVACFAVLFGLLVATKRGLAGHPEVRRKLLHVGMGLATLSFPVLFAKTWPVWLLCGLFGAILGAIRFVPALQRRLGHVLGGVERRSWGEFYFALGVAVVFAIAHEHLAWYAASVLVLTLADAVAALVGVYFGITKYDVECGWKSMEGSLAFFSVAAVCTLVTSLLNGQPWLKAGITAVCVGVLAALVEAVSWRGLDNLFLPVATLVMLIRFEDNTPAELFARLAREQPDVPWTLPRTCTPCRAARRRAHETVRGDEGDLMLRCVVCGDDFPFGSRDREYYTRKGFRYPRRCPRCRGRR
jgi:phytol kinase